MIVVQVLRAYSLLVEEPDPSKEKGYVAALYSGIKRCLPDKHLHLQTKTDYINKLITRAEPELLGRYDLYVHICFFVFCVFIDPASFLFKLFINSSFKV